MITRRTFLAGAAAMTTAPLVERVAKHFSQTGEVKFVRPPKVERRFYLHPEEKGLRLVTDAVEFPLPIVKFDAFEQKLGPGSYRKHTQRDHWRMIEEGQFEENDLITPGVGMGQFSAWQGNFAPTSEAVSFLEEHGLGPDGDAGPGPGISFYEWGDDPEVFGPAALIDDLFSASLLQASFVERGIPVEILRQERGWIRFLSGDHFWKRPVSPKNYFEDLDRNDRTRRNPNRHPFRSI
jgi:hypothetical protein